MQYEQVFDSRHRRMRGLWKKRNTFYAQMRIEGRPVRYPLHSAKTVPEALTEQQVLKKQLREGTLPWPPPGSRLKVGKPTDVATVPTLSEAVDAYLVHIKHMGKKRDGTIDKETVSLGHWTQKFGSLPVNQFTFTQVHQFASWRKEKVMKDHKLNGRTIDIDVIAMRHVLERELELGHIFVQPIGKWKKLAGVPKKKRLISSDELQIRKRNAERLCSTRSYPS
jgi:hypothetical protein